MSDPILAPLAAVVAAASVALADAGNLAAVLTCVGAMAGVGLAGDAAALAVTIRAPFDASRMDQVRAVVAAIDAGAVWT